MAKKDKAQDERPALRKRPEGLMANIVRTTSRSEEKERGRRHPGSQDRKRLWDLVIDED